MYKFSILRGENIRKCPYGLPVALACMNAGNSVQDMEPLDNVPDEQKEKYTEANKRVYRHSQDGTSCIYADKIIEHRDVVVCDFGDTGQGEHESNLSPSPFYPRTFGNIAQTTMAAYPYASYADVSSGRQLFDGIFNSFADKEQILIEKTSEAEQDLSNTYDIEGILEE